MGRIKVYFQATMTYAAELDYDDLVKLAQADDPDGYLNPGDVLTVPPESDIPAGHGIDMDVWAGSELSERLWVIGKQVDSTETRLTGLERPTS